MGIQGYTIILYLYICVKDTHYSNLWLIDHCGIRVDCYTFGMALTAEDKKFVSTVMKRTVTRSVTRIVTQILAETVQPQLNLIRQDLKLMDSRITALEVRLTSLEKSVWGSMEGLKIYMETQFRRIDSRFDRNMLIEDKQSEKSE